MSEQSSGPGTLNAMDSGSYMDDDGARQALLAVRREVAKAVVGQDATVTGLLIAMLSQGHVLLEGVPGVAKTLLVRALSSALSLDTKRVQFTPDLMPGDVTGSLVYDSRTSEFSFREGPVFTNLLLADEINRTPPKTQASLLEAMEERQVSVDGASRRLPAPFLVAATQNPVEYEGTYALPEAQLDRFLLKLTMPLPERGDEIEVIRRHAAGFDPRDLAAAGVRAVAGAEDLERAREAVTRVAVEPEIIGYIVDLVRQPGPPLHSSWESHPAVPLPSSTPHGPGHGSPAARSSPLTTSRHWHSRACGTGWPCSPKPRWTASGWTMSWATSWRPSPSPADGHLGTLRCAGAAWPGAGAAVPGMADRACHRCRSRGPVGCRPGLRGIPSTGQRGARGAWKRDA